MSVFHIKDCVLIVQATNLQAVNLRELREGVRQCEAASLYHHFCETLLRPTFDDPIYHNDFGMWAAYELHDPVLAERLGIIDPYEFRDMEELRLVVLDILDDRLSESPMVPWAKMDHRFHFIKAVTVVFDTGRVIENPDALPAAILKMSLGSIYFHVVEALRREPFKKNDFTAWLENEREAGVKYLAPFEKFTSAFPPLKELKRDLVAMLDSTTTKD